MPLIYLILNIYRDKLIIALSLYRKDIQIFIFDNFLKILFENQQGILFIQI